MGCATSKIDDTEAVARCRRRLTLLDAAVHHRYAAADSHFAYLHSLNSLGDSLHLFFQSAASFAGKPPSPVLPLPSHRKTTSDNQPPPLHHLQLPSSSHRSSGHHLSPSSSGSHIHFHPDSDSDESEYERFEEDPTQREVDSTLKPIGLPTHKPSSMWNDSHLGYSTESFHHLQHSFPSPHMHHQNLQNMEFNLNPGYSTTHMNFMIKHPIPSVSYQQTPIGTESIQFGMSNPPYSPYYTPNQNPNSYSNGDPYDSGGYSVANSAPSSSKRPPPPPPAPASSSPWDFLNPFENIEASYPEYTPSRRSRDSREVREEEGIPDLEDEDLQGEVVKEVTSSDGAPAEVKDDNGGPDSEASPEQDPVEYEVHVVEKSVVGEEGRKSEKKGDVGGSGSVCDAVSEIQVQFKRAADSGAEMVEILEVGKLPYRRKSSSYQVSSTMMHAIAPSLSLSSRDSDVLSEEVGLSASSLSATMQKLFLWEKKLLEEVKVEEKMRVMHDRKVEKLIKLVERGAEVHKIDTTQTAIRDLSTKVRISIQIIDKISAKVSKLRDEDLWLHLNELIQGLARMWKGMLECHHSQCQAVEGAKGLDAIAYPDHSSDAHLQAALRLEHELINWTLRFSDWINAQKGYITALNGWLRQCIDTSDEETPDGPAPFSPGRAGAPPVFVICNQWALALDHLSETEVLDSMRVFAAMVFRLCERDTIEMRQRTVSNKDVERKVKDLEQKVNALDKRMRLSSADPDGFSLSANVVYPLDTSNKSGLQAGLRRIFEAMEGYASESLKVYEDLLARGEEVARDRAGA